jgi:nucleotide-binding universal stress UspA family protein
MKTIIAPTDFSPASLNAVDYALDLACSINASIYLLHVYQLPISVSEIPVSAEEIEAVQKDAEGKMKRLKQKVDKKAGEKIKVYSRLKIGTILNEVESLCESVKPYAVVMGTQGVGAVKRFILGSNTIAAVRHLSYPLIAVPPKAKYTGIKKIGLACDMRKVIDTIPAKEIKLLVKEFKAELHVIYINSEGDPMHVPETVEESAFLQEMLDELHPSYHTLNNPHIEEGISAYAKRHDLDLLIVIPKKHGLLEALFHKSLSKQLVLHTHIPVMAI